MNLREKIARALCARAGHDPDAYGFGTDQDGAQLRPKLWELYVVFAETALDCITVPPTEAAIAAGIAMLRGNDDGPASASTTGARRSTPPPEAPGTMKTDFCFV